ncbi:MAG TPA: hypothetical protein VJW76_07560 [Verrucomicrobiae bacterium]|nr:hypothetical protein [Verrucomicrobiae bacterium]
MRTSRRNLIAVAVLTVGTVLCPRGWAGFVYENPAEFTASGDFDGDGRPDVVIVDRASGTYRIGYQLSSGSFTWASPRASGIDVVSGVGLGRLAATSTDALAFTAPEGNRINVFTADNPNFAGLPLSLFSPAIGPSLLVAIDVGGTGNTALDDFIIGSELNGGQPFQLEAARNQGSALQVLNVANLSASPRRGNAVALKTGNPPLAAVLVRSGANDLFKVWQLTGGTLAEVLTAPVGPPFGLDYTFGFFNSSSPFAQFLFYKPGTNGLMLRPVQEPTPGAFTLAAGPVFNLGDDLRQVFTIPGVASPRLLVIFGEGGTANVYDFDGSSFPVVLQTFTAGAGETFTGAAVLAGGDVMLLTGAPGSGLSSGFRRYAVNGATYTLQSSGALPSLNALSHRANVMTFQLEPFVTSAPNLLQSFNAGDWTSLYVPQAGSQASVTFETFVDPQTGLGSPIAQALSPINPLAQFSLVNQYREPISLFRLTPAVGSEVADVTILPAPGTYKTSIQVSFKTVHPQNRVYYRLGQSSSWIPFTFPFRIFKDTTVSFYATPDASGTPLKSVIRQASYHFTELPQNLDSDGDGVPDYVEIAKGLDPVTSGSDADGDGYSDLDELTSGKNPGDADDFPAGEPRQDLHAAVDLIQAPQAVDGVSGLAADCAHGTFLRAFDLSGDLLSIGSATLVSLPQLNGPAAVLSNVVVDVDMRLVAVATDPHFDIVTGQADKRIGRELIRLLDTTDFVDPVSLPHTWSGGDVSTEANLWITTTSNQLLNVTRKQIVGNMGAYDTLAALLVEKKVRTILLSRGASQFLNLTLFPFRAGDAGRPSLAAEDLAALESETANGLPGFQLSHILGAIETALASTPPNDPAQQLKALAWEIYRVSSASNNIPPGAQSWPFLPSPVDTLRDFLETGVVQSNYAASAALSGLVAPAFAQSQTILNGIGGRPVVMVNLKIRPDTFLGGCVLLDTLDGAQTRSLLNAMGAPFEFLDAFSLPPGTVVTVKGYNDVINLGCPGSALEVIEATLFAPPQFTSEDLDGDLLPDALELALFGSLSANGFGDFDGDGFSNLQEIFDGTDPNNKSSGGVQIVNFALPAVQLQVAPAAQIKLQFQWPAAYANKVQFGVVGAPNLGTPFTYVPAVQSFLGNDTFELNLPDAGGAAFFYQIFVTLK